MAFTVKLWQFSKPVNSTENPPVSPAPVSYSCTANDNLSVVAPVIKIREPITTDMSLYNYAEIPDFHRFYWITDIVYDSGLWFLTMRVDPLASWKSQIGSLSPYILRSAYSYDGTILDTFYPAKSKYIVKNQTATSPWEYGSYTSGCYSVGIISQGGITDFWIMSRSELAGLLQYMLSNQFAIDMIGELQLTAYEEAKAICDPLQYISSVTWLPISLPATLLTNLHVGYSTIPVTCAAANPSNPATYTLSFVIPTHNQAASRGTYMNGPPYSTYSLYVPPFGRIDLDASVVMGAGSVYAYIYLDKCLGNGTLEIRASNTLLCRVSGKIGMPVQLSQVISSGYGILSAAGTAAEVAGSAVSLNFGGAASALASGIKDAITGQIPKVNTVGSVGSCDSLIGTPKLQMVCAEVVDDDLTSRGRPLCKVGQISSYPGYLLCADVEVNIGCTEAEHQMIKSYMESGFFYA